MKTTPTPRVSLNPEILSTAGMAHVIKNCDHLWEPLSAVLWGQLRVDGRCMVCKTFSGKWIEQ